LPANLRSAPTKVNAAVVENLTPQQSAQLQAAKQLSAVYKLNKCTPDIYQFLLKLVEQHGSLAGMLRTVSVPLSHVGYQLPAPGEGIDLQYMQLTASLAVTAMQSYAQQVHAGCAALGWQLPAAPTRPVLLQTTPDLLCADWEQLQRSLESPAVAPEAALGAAAGSVAAALAAAAGVAQAVARGDTAAAVAAAQQATEAAAAALTAAGGIQQQFVGLGTSQQSAAGLDEAVWADGAADELLSLPDPPSPGLASPPPAPVCATQRRMAAGPTGSPELPQGTFGTCSISGQPLSVASQQQQVQQQEQQQQDGGLSDAPLCLMGVCGTPVGHAGSPSSQQAPALLLLGSSSNRSSSSRWCSGHCQVPGSIPSQRSSSSSWTT
jgi:hypothetical protein